MNPPRLEVARGRAAHGQDAVRPAGHARAQAGARPDPNPVFKGDVTHDKVEGGLFVVVVAAKEKGALGQATVVAYGHLAEVVDPDLIPNPAVVPDGQFPRVLDGHAWLHHDPSANLGPKRLQQASLQAIGPRKPSLEEPRRNEGPDHPCHEWAWLVI